jgi:ribosomal protein S18 acetylase RimI-like enzyme
VSESSALTIRHGVVEDAAELSSFMSRAFTSAFGALNRPEYLATFLAEKYNGPRQAEELRDPAMLTLVAELDGKLAGYAQISSGPYLPACVTGPGPIELSRFYVDPALIGRGIARPLMDRAKAEAYARGGRTCWLGVWEINARAIAFYRKAGFREVGTHPFDVGGDRQTDLVMLTTLEPA